MRKAGFTILLVLLMAEIFSLVPPRVKEEPNEKYRRGAIHVLTSASIPYGESVESILEAAAQTNLDFVVLADTDSVAARDRAGRHEVDGKAVDLTVEMEATTPGGQLVYFHSHTGAADLSAERLKKAAWQQFLGASGYPGAFTATAHPSHVNQPWTRLDRYPDGLEVMNLDALWNRHWFRGLIAANFTALLGPFNPFVAGIRMVEPFSSDFNAWDGMNAFAIGKFGYVAHDGLARHPLLNRWDVHYPSYRHTFKMAVNLVRAKKADNFERSRLLLYRAIREGRVVMALPFLYPTGGADWWLQCGNKRHFVGDRVPLVPGCEFKLKMPPQFPYPAEFRLWSAGNLVQKGPVTPDWSYPIEAPGPYRMEVWVKLNTVLHLLVDKELPYLLFNPIHVL